MCKVNIIGDSHLGKQFINGVPLHRRGERENMVWLDFMNKLSKPCDLCVQTGDLFDSFIVPPEVVIRAYNLYACAASANPDTQYVIISGNHDASRNAERSSSFELFQVLCARLPNVHVVTKFALGLKVKDELFGFCPWHPFKTSVEVAKDLHLDQKHKMVFGHWDTQPFNGDTSNVIPYEVLSGKVETIVTGHIHLPQEFTYKGQKVEVVGSMQPYSHSEDAVGNLYQTYMVSSVDQIHPDEFKNKNIRLIAQRGDTIPEIDCLSLTIKYVEAEDEIADISVEFKDFDIHQLFADCLNEQEVSESVMQQVTAKFKELRK